MSCTIYAKHHAFTPDVISEAETSALIFLKHTFFSFF